MWTDVVAYILLRMVSDVCQVQHLKLELATDIGPYITIIHTILTPYAPHLSSIDITFFTNLKYQLLKILP
jgi:hypothetical protein